MRPFAALLLLLPLSASALEDEPGTGRVVVAVGKCRDSMASSVTIFTRKVGGGPNRNYSMSDTIFDKAFGSATPRYADGDGAFALHVAALPAGEWEAYQHWVNTKDDFLGGHKRFSSNREYAWRFRIEEGKVTDLGRFCAFTQAEGYRPREGGPLEQRRVRWAWLVLSANRPEDLAAAQAGGAAPRGLVDARESRAGVPGWRNDLPSPREIELGKTAPGGPTMGSPPFPSNDGRPP